MNLPSRGLRESAMTMRYVGCFLRPVRRRRILTDISKSSLGFLYCFRAHRTSDVFRLHPIVLQMARLPHPEHVRLELSTALRGGLLHHLLHLAELLEQAIHLADRAARALG